MGVDGLAASRKPELERERESPSADPKDEVAGAATPSSIPSISTSVPAPYLLPALDFNTPPPVILAPPPLRPNPSSRVSRTDEAALTSSISCSSPIPIPIPFPFPLPFPPFIRAAPVPDTLRLTDSNDRRTALAKPSSIPPVLASPPKNATRLAILNKDEEGEKERAGDEKEDEDEEDAEMEDASG